MSGLTLVNIRKEYDKGVVSVQDFNLEVGDNFGKDFELRIK